MSTLCVHFDEICNFTSSFRERMLFVIQLMFLYTLDILYTTVVFLGLDIVY